MQTNIYEDIEYDSEFLFNLLIKDNKHLIPIDFIDIKNKANNYACICVCFSLAQHYIEIRRIFLNQKQFLSKYLDIYVAAVESYITIVGKTFRQISLDEVQQFYSCKLSSITMTNINEELNRLALMDYLNLVQINNSYFIISKNDISFIIIHYINDDFIIIDSHTLCAGILSKNNVYNYIIYNQNCDSNICLITISNNEFNENTLDDLNDLSDLDGSK